ncbi:hypothetical protein [Nocardia arthritidis]|uniref:Uncharacterized protein n=1 Tax=Nocardia arthritidis TaxID=228602 RepID=A0A6G9YAD8_9NOCA|nr:hypothetical protein [Nocardia arthritidis]QIS10128.1 hypothetical protein F5544_11170 [Nocardia arthritidis]
MLLLKVALPEADPVANWALPEALPEDEPVPAFAIGATAIRHATAIAVPATDLLNFMKP